MSTHVADKAYAASGEAISVLHTMAVLQVFQAQLHSTLSCTLSFQVQLDSILMRAHLSQERIRYLMSALNTFRLGHPMALN